MKKIFFIVFLFLFFLLVGYLATFKFLDPDFGWHLRTGQLILERGVPKNDWYSFTFPEFTWIDHYWLTEIFLYKIYSFGGIKISLIIFLIFAISSFFAVLSWKNFKFYLFPLLIGYFSSIPFFGIRPQIITLFFIGLFWKILNGFFENEKSREIYFLPFLFFLWANLHGGFFIGLFLFFFVLTLEMLKKNKVFQEKIKKKNFKIIPLRKFSNLFFVFIASFLFTFLNPYGIKIYQEIFRMMYDFSAAFHIVEWLPLFSTGINLFQFLYISFFFGLFITQYKKIEFSQLTISILFFLFSLRSQRHYLIFVILTIPVFSQMIFSLKEEIGSEKLKFLYSKNKKWVILFFLFIFGYQIHRLYLSFLSPPFQLTYPEKAIEYLKNLPLSENLFNEYHWGGYLIWKLPERKVFIDGRMSYWQTKEKFVLKDFIEIMNVSRNFQGVLEKYDLKIALLKKERKREEVKKINEKYLAFFKKHQLIAKFLNISLEEKNIYRELLNLGWKLIYEDETAILLRKTN